MQNNYGNADVVYAGFWVRMAAYLIDSVVVFAGLLFVRLFMAGVSAAVEGTMLDGNILFQYTLKDIVLYVFQVLYFILCTAYTGTTLGKKAMNLRVINADESQKLSLLNVTYRETVGRFLCGLSVGIGYIMAGVDREKRGLHDMLCDTRVIYAKKIKLYPVYQAPAASGSAPIQGIPPHGASMQGMPPHGASMQGMPPHGTSMQAPRETPPQDRMHFQAPPQGTARQRENTSEPSAQHRNGADGEQKQ